MKHSCRCMQVYPHTQFCKEEKMCVSSFPKNDIRNKKRKNFSLQKQKISNQKFSLQNKISNSEEQLAHWSISFTRSCYYFNWLSVKLRLALALFYLN